QPTRWLIRRIKMKPEDIQRCEERAKAELKEAEATKLVVSTSEQPSLPAVIASSTAAAATSTSVQANTQTPAPANLSDDIALRQLAAFMDVASVIFGIMTAVFFIGFFGNAGFGGNPLSNGYCLSYWLFTWLVWFVIGAYYFGAPISKYIRTEL